MQRIGLRREEKKKGRLKRKVMVKPEMRIRILKTSQWFIDLKYVSRISRIKRLQESRLETVSSKIE